MAPVDNKFRPPPAIPKHQALRDKRKIILMMNENNVFLMESPTKKALKHSV